ncbi:hypothetical protein AMK18_29120 [Streptomyces sp. CB01249]|uniref:hypothetical protein n=1 Tax=Streptomyces sp. CB01249 TaxID=1703929 RepID=UPI0009393080|nr:hypothetical protein [Streptomyces sp. CB01249]OKI94930.1 hypothetical protein AMK18_29120 [Streptomyces sp. CB01249]
MATVLKVSPVATGRKPRKGEPPLPPVSPFSHVVKVADGPAGESRVLAHLERELPPGGIPAYLAARKDGARSFVLWADPERRARLATVVTASSGDGVSAYQVLGGYGEVLGTVVREKACSGKGLRTRWTVAQTGCPEAVGLKGRIFWWYVWWLLFPLWLAIGVGSLVSGGGDVPRGPRRIRWRAAGETPFEFHSDGEVVVHAQWTDQRLAAALTALITSFDSWLGTPWDDKRE